MTKRTKYPNIEKMQYGSCTAGKVILSMRLLTPIYKKHLKKHNITLSQWGIMSVLTHYRKIAQADLGRIMALERSTITRDLKRLLERGYIKREGVVNKLTIEITEKGLEYIDTIIPDWEKAKEESKVILGEDGEQALDLVLTKMSQHVMSLNKK